MKYVIYKYSNEREVIYESNSIEEIVKYWESISEESVEIGWCEELGYCLLGASDGSIQLQTPEYYNTNQFKLS